jgi:iron complex transport system substrate-binding protein
MRIICLTEETVETLYLLGRQDLIIGVSEYVERPAEAKKNHPIVTQFIRSDIEQIAAMKPDLVIGFSDLQKDIASQLIGRGLNVLVTNQRSLKEILNNILLLGRMIGEESKALTLVKGFEEKLESYKNRKYARRPKVYFEEWDHPRFSFIKWVYKHLNTVGGVKIISHNTVDISRYPDLTDEEIKALNPDIIFGCWCGKAVKLESFQKRYPETTAVKNGHLWELDPAIFLQPGPALFVDGLDQMFEKIQTLDG